MSAASGSGTGLPTGFGERWLVRHQLPDAQGDVVTFYSYKGGTGRSMALVNCAGLLAQAMPSGAKPILLLDFDLEAPGLHRYLAPFLPEATAASDRPGVLELFEALHEQVQQRLQNGPAALDGKAPHLDDEAASEIVESFDLAPYLIATSTTGLSLVKAGRFDDSYDQRLSRFDWEDLFIRAPGLFRALAHRLAGHYSYTLIDSRTGLSDTSGICTMLLPDVLVMVFTPNSQSLTGIDHLLRKAAAYRDGAADGRGLRVYPLPSRVDNQVEHFRQVWRMGATSHALFGDVAGYQPMFERVLDGVLASHGASLQAYFDLVQVPHSADYAYGERLCFTANSASDSLSIRSSYEQLLAWLATGAQPWERPAAVLLNQQADVWTRQAALQEAPAEATGWRPWFERLARMETGLQHPARQQFGLLSAERQTSVSLMLTLAYAARDDLVESTDWLRRAQQTFSAEAESVIADGAPAQLMRQWAEQLGPAQLQTADRLAWVTQMRQLMIRWQPMRGQQIAWLEALSLLAAKALWPEIERESLQDLARLYGEAFGDDDPRSLHASNELALVLRAQGRLAEARERFEKLLDSRRRLAGDDDPATLTAAGNLAVTLLALGEVAAGRDLQQRVLEAQRRVLGDEHPDTATSMSHLANVLVSEGRLAEAEQLQRQALSVKLHLYGENHVETLKATGNLASVLRAMNRLEEARTLEEAFAANARTVLGEDHPITLTALGNLAQTFAMMGRIEEAQALQRQVIDALTRSLGEQHPSTLTAQNNLAHTLLRAGELGAALELQRRVLEIQQRVLGDQHPDVFIAMGNLAETLRAQGDLMRAAELQQRVVEGRQRVMGADHPHTLIAMHNLAQTYVEMGDAARAAAVQREALAASRRALGDEDPQTFAAMNDLAASLQSLGRLDEARALLEQALTGSRHALGEEHLRTLSTMNNLAGLLKHLEQREAAAQLQRQVLEVSRRVFGAADANTVVAMGNLANTLWEAGDSAEARSLQQQVVDQQRLLLPAEHPDLWASTMALATILLDDGDAAAAAAALDSFQSPPLTMDNPQWLGLRLRVAERLGDRTGVIRYQRRLADLLKPPQRTSVVPPSEAT